MNVPCECGDRYLRNATSKAANLLLLLHHKAMFIQLRDIGDDPLSLFLYLFYLLLLFISGIINQARGHGSLPSRWSLSWKDPRDQPPSFAHGTWRRCLGVVDSGWGPPWMCHGTLAIGPCC
ncbi:hypothetical protein AAC387_Pa07g2496 [Persea americana]